MKKYIYIALSIGSLLVTGCDNKDKKSTSEITTEPKAVTQATTKQYQPIIKQNNHLILTHMVEIYSTNPILEQVIRKKDGEDSFVKTISYDENGMIKAYSYTYSNKDNPYLTGTIKYTDKGWHEEVNYLTNDEIMTFDYIINDNQQIIDVKVSDNSYEIDEKTFKQAFIYNQDNALTDMIYVFNKILCNSHYKYNQNGLITDERAVLTELEAQADANYQYNDKGQLVSFSSSEFYSTEATSKADSGTQDNGYVKPETRTYTFGEAEFNQRGDWVKLTEKENGSEMTRTITYRQ
ncbi:hypothetical protein [Candidatus Schmidhempelia bombi]|uniref:DUF4595 domain-containing protein n=1 Tax=Candidatus Schmidhempelia bombi str. Bimp TaxID=1387197 RepID=A0AB94ID70_9GAMM|nr:hypothetical protein [Candidatus Schmidhempelia bombi]TEA27370.1 hypothetical protein O970_04090 [Candidatus Schmidhempelia bombi str. Bimp]